MKNCNNILIVEDEFLTSEFIKQTLLNLNYNVVAIVTNAEDAKKILATHEINLILMDININGSIDGLTLAKEIKNIYDVAIVFTTAYADNQTIEESNEANTYGYLIKPFDEHDIEATLKVAFNLIKKDKNYKTAKIKSTENEIFFNENCKYNFDTKILYKKDNIIKLTHKERDVFHFLSLHINTPVNYELLANHVWDNSEISDSTIRDTILKIRKKAPFLNIENMPKIGYILKKDSMILES